MAETRSTQVLVALLALLPGLGLAEPLRIGAQVSLDGAVGLRGGAARGESIHGLALVTGEWRTARGSEENFDRAFVSVLGLAGRGPTSKFLGDLLTVSNSEGFESLRLYASWWETNRRTWSIRAGLLLADEEFGHSDAGSELLNASFGWPIFISANTRNTGPAFFAAGWGVRVRWQMSERGALQVGVYDGDTFDSLDGDAKTNRSGLHNHLSGQQGLFAMAEYRAGITERSRFKLGGWAHTGDFEDMYFDRSGASFVASGGDPKRHRRNFGGYAVLEHALRGAPGETGSIDGYIRLGAAPANRNSVSWAFDLGSAWHGPLPGRPQDVVALGFTSAHRSAGFRRASREADPTLPSPDYEQVFELTYRWTVSERLNVQPDLQYIRHPGGSPRFGDALVFLLRVTARF